MNFTELINIHLLCTLHRKKSTSWRRKNKGLKLNYPEAVAYITSAALEEARAGKSVEEVMVEAANVLKKEDVMDGVADMISLLQVEAVFTDGSRLVSIHQPIK